MLLRLRPILLSLRHIWIGFLCWRASSARNFSRRSDMTFTEPIPKHPFVRVIEGGTPEEICAQIIDGYNLWGDEARIRVISSRSQRRELFEYVGIDEKESMATLVAEIIKRYNDDRH